MLCYHIKHYSIERSGYSCGWYNLGMSVTEPYKLDFGYKSKLIVIWLVYLFSKQTNVNQESTVSIQSIHNKANRPHLLLHYLQI